MPDTRPTILVGDDAGGMLRLASFALRASGYRILRTHKGQRLVSQYRHLEPRPDVVLLDVSSPGLASIHMYEVLYMMDRELPALFLGEDDSRQLELLPEAARWQILRPPYTFLQLLQSVDMLLGPGHAGHLTAGSVLAEGGVSAEGSVPAEATVLAEAAAAAEAERSAVAAS